MRLLILGTGSMAAAHAARFKKIRGVKVVAAVETNAERRAAFAAEHRIANTFASLGEALAWNQFDAATNVTPDAVHYPTTMQLIAAKKNVFCEKPLATNYADAIKMTKAAEKAGIINMVNLTYRSSPALNKAREMTLSGKLGIIRHFEASYRQSWLVGRQWGDWHTEDRWLWRLSTAHGSKGVVGDVGVHIIDFATFAAGSDVAGIAPMVRTFHKAPGDRIGKYKLDANDSFVTTAQLKNGAMGFIQATRFATGYGNDLDVTLFGDKGALQIHTDGNVSSLKACLGQKNIDTQTWREVKCPPVPSTYQRFAAAVASGKNGDPSFRRAADVQRVLDACLAHGGDKLVKVG